MALGGGARRWRAVLAGAPGAARRRRPSRRRSPCRWHARRRRWRGQARGAARPGSPPRPLLICPKPLEPHARIDPSPSRASTWPTPAEKARTPLRPGTCAGRPGPESRPARAANPAGRRCPSCSWRGNPRLTARQSGLHRPAAGTSRLCQNWRQAAPTWSGCGHDSQAANPGNSRGPAGRCDR